MSNDQVTHTTLDLIKECKRWEETANTKEMKGFVAEIRFRLQKFLEIERLLEVKQ